MLDDDPDGPSFVAEVTKQYMEDAAEHTTKLRTLATEDDPQWKKIDATAHQFKGSSSKCVVAAAAPGARRSPQRRRSARPALLPSDWQVLSRPTEVADPCAARFVLLHARTPPPSPSRLPPARSMGADKVTKALVELRQATIKESKELCLALVDKVQAAYDEVEPYLKKFEGDGADGDEASADAPAPKTDGADGDTKE